MCTPWKLAFRSMDRVTLKGAGDRPLLWALYDELGLQGPGSTAWRGTAVLARPCRLAPVRACITPVESVAGSRGADNRGRLRRRPCRLYGVHRSRPAGLHHMQQRAVMCGVPLRATPDDGETLMDRLAENICYCLRYGDIRSACSRPSALPPTPTPAVTSTKTSSSETHAPTRGRRCGVAESASAFQPVFAWDSRYNRGAAARDDVGSAAGGARKLPAPGHGRWRATEAGWRLALLPGGMKSAAAWRMTALRQAPVKRRGDENTVD